MAPSIRLKIRSIDEAVSKRRQYASLFGIPAHTVEMSIKGKVTVLSNLRLIDIPTFRVVESLKQQGGVANLLAEIRVEGRPAWVILPSGSEPIELLLQEV